MNLQKLKQESEELRKKVCDTINEAGRITIIQAWKIIQEAIAETVIIIENNIGTELDGAQKKAHALAIIERIINTVATIIDIPGVPDWLELWFDKYLKILLLSIADGSIDAIVSTLKKVGIFIRKNKEGTSDV